MWKLSITCTEAGNFSAVGSSMCRHGVVCLLAFAFVFVWQREREIPAVGMRVAENLWLRCWHVCFLQKLSMCRERDKALFMCAWQRVCASLRALLVPATVYLCNCCLLFIYTCAPYPCRALFAFHFPADWYAGLDEFRLDALQAH